VQNDPSSNGIVEVIRNNRQLYTGNLAKYFQALLKARNINHPYHNLRHMLHVTWQCHQASIFYGHLISLHNVRNLLIAAMFHDFDHSGRSGNDDLNIELAIRGFKKHIQPEDIPSKDDIESLMRITEYPPMIDSSELTLRAQILRDADISQALSPVWIQQVIVGLAKEQDRTFLEMLKQQEPFLSNLKFHTEWAKTTFPPEVIQAKIQEARDLIEILEKK